MTSGGAAAATIFQATSGNLWQTTVTFLIAGGWGLWQQNQLRKINQWLRTNDWCGTDFENDPALPGRSLQKKMGMSALYAALLLIGEWGAHGLHFLGTGSEAARIAMAQVLIFHSLFENPLTIILRGAAVSAATQTCLATVNGVLTENAIKRNPEQTFIYERWSGVAALIQSMVMVTLNNLNLQGGVLGWTAFSLAMAIGASAGVVQYYIDPSFRGWVRSLALFRHRVTVHGTLSVPSQHSLPHSQLS